MITNVEDLAPASVVAEILAASIHSIAEQGLAGHDLDTVKARFDDNPSAIARAAKTYAESIRTGKAGQGAKRDAALAVVTHYRVQHNL
ncbi:hypothetical protein ACH4TS_22665 [Streptomyces albidoflavus]|uniref:hypothetical protein n=1 Tax=Streptomyces sp. B29(2018) TaxID=2485016 RepID=UPI000FD65E51|nr:hypothetical protein [Streptomyces sp. B29(2018)]